MTYQFKIQIKGLTKPPVWRVLTVPADFTFENFHTAIQIAFGWENYHLFEFTGKGALRNMRIAIPSEFDCEYDEYTQDASELKLSDVFTAYTQSLLYIYDFGDSWEHEITLKSSSPKTQKGAVCLSGKGACPPEDCGGIYGYERMKQVFQADPEGEEAHEYREWLCLEEDEVWDSNAVSIEEINEELKCL